MRRTTALAAAVLLASVLLAQDADPRSWQNLSRLAPGQAIEVVNTKGESVKGTFASVSEESIGLTGKSRNVAIPRAEVSRVRLRKGSKHILIGAVIGGGAGAGIGAAAGEGLAQASGGDFRNLKPGIIAAACAVGVLVGVLVGSLIGNRHTTVYRAK